MATEDTRSVAPDAAKGRAFATIPPVYGLSVADASAILAEAGFEPVASPRRFGDPDLVVDGTVPPEGAAAFLGGSPAVNGDGYLSREEFRELWAEFWIGDDPSLTTTSPYQRAGADAPGARRRAGWVSSCSASASRRRSANVMNSRVAGDSWAPRRHVKANVS